MINIKRVSLLDRSGKFSLKKMLRSDLNHEDMAN